MDVEPRRSVAGNVEVGMSVDISNGSDVVPEIEALLAAEAPAMDPIELFKNIADAEYPATREGVSETTVLLNVPIRLSGKAVEIRLLASRPGHSATMDHEPNPMKGLDGISHGIEDRNTGTQLAGGATR